MARQGRTPDYCDKCATPWGKAGSTSTSQRWKHLERFVYTALASLPFGPLRAGNLAPLSETIVKKARGDLTAANRYTAY